MGPAQSPSCFDSAFCDEVRSVLAKDPLICNRVRISTCSASGKSPSDNTIRDIWNNFNKNGIQVTKSGPGCHKDDAKRDRIKELIAAGDLSTRKIANIAGTSQTLVIDVLKSMKKFFYRAPRGQNLKERDCKRRLDFAYERHEEIESKRFDWRNCAFSDEAMGSPNANRRNFGFWRFKGQFDDWEDKMVTGKCYEQKVHTFVLLHWKIGALGPYFVEDIPQLGPFDQDGNPIKVVYSLTADRYLWLLEHQVIPDLRGKLGEEDFAKCWWQQDGAPSHTAERVMVYLRKIFGERIMSNARLEESRLYHSDWPPYSPDLNPLDYFFWSHLRELLHIRDPRTKKDIINAIRELVPLIKLDHIRRAIDDFPIRIEALLQCRGAHFEYHLKSLKVSRNSALERQCDICDSRHACPCDDCKRRCLQKKMNRSGANEIINFDDPYEYLQQEADSAWHEDDSMYFGDWQ